jgi:hypothetical protein
VPRFLEIGIGTRVPQWKSPGATRPPSLNRGVDNSGLDASDPRGHAERWHLFPFPHPTADNSEWIERHAVLP